MKNPKTITMNLDRPNIYLSFKQKTEIWDDLKPYIIEGNSIIIYALLKSKSEEIAYVLRRHEIVVETYHTDVSIEKRTEILVAFKAGRLKVIVATIAFGMGIDMPNIRSVIHYGSSKNLESYTQEIGRAGRDNKPSKAITFYGGNDSKMHQWFIDQVTSKGQREHLNKIGLEMSKLTQTADCRR